MEVIVILAMLVLVFKNHIITLLKTKMPDVAANLEPLIKYLGASAVLSATIAVLPTLLMIVYMRNQGFYAYELFNQDSQAFNVLAGNVLVNFLMLSFGFFGAAILFATKADKWLLILISIVNAVMVSYFLLVAYVSSQGLLAFVMLVTTGLIAAYLYYWFGSGMTGKATLWFIPLIV